MHVPSDAEIDRIAAEAADDLRAFAGIWTRDGPGALDAAVRGDQAFSFAVLDARDVGGTIRLVALRRPAQALLLEFGQAADGARIIGARGLMPFYHGALLTADPAFAAVTVSDGADIWPASRADAVRVAFELAWRFDIDVDAIAHATVAPQPLPADFESDDVGAFAPELMAVLDAAADVLAGRVSYSEGLPAIVARRWTCGLPVSDRDLTGVYATDLQRDEMDAMLRFHREQKKGAWTYADELADFEIFAREQAEGHCRSLIARFRGDAFARL
jgi:hypothetical protein